MACILLESYPAPVPWMTSPIEKVGHPSDTRQS